MPEEKKSCFFIAPIGERGSCVRDRSNQVLDLIIRPEVKDFGYRAERGDEVVGPDLNIMSNVLKRIIEDDLVIADLTGNNPNVFYELAIRHAVAKPLIQIADQERQQELAFNLAGLTVVYVDHRDPEGIREARNAIRRHLEIIRDEGGPTLAPLAELAGALTTLASLIWTPQIDPQNLNMAIRSARRIEGKLRDEPETRIHAKALIETLETLRRSAQPPPPLKDTGRAR